MTFANFSFGKNLIDRFFYDDTEIHLLVSPEMEDLLICAGSQDRKE